MTTEKITMWKLRTLYSGGYEIEKVFVDKKTEASVWVKGRRYARSIDRLQYSDTFEMAKEVALVYLRDEADALRRQLDYNDAVRHEIVFLEADQVKETVNTY